MAEKNGKNLSEQTGDESDPAPERRRLRTFPHGTVPPEALPGIFAHRLAVLLAPPAAGFGTGAGTEPSAAPATAGPWIAALSAGCDSTALCRLLRAAARLPESPVPRDPAAICAVHVHHGLRGPEADIDEKAARETARALGFSFRSVRLDPPAALPRGAVEKWARAERYRVLLDAARKIRAPLVLTGHTKNDQAETVLLRILHRSGYWGLAGIRPVRPIAPGAKIRLVRPLLSFTRAELAAYLADIGQTFREDRTNAEVFYERNKIRHLLVPRLEKTFPGDLAAALCGLAGAARSLHVLLDRAAAAILDGSGPFSIPLDLFAAAPEPLRFALLRLASLRIAPRQVPLKERAFAAISRTLGETPRARAFSLGGGVAVRLENRVIVVEAETGIAGAGQGPFVLPVPGILDLPDGRRLVAGLTIDRGRAMEIMLRHRPEREVLDADRAGSPLAVRYRRPGDTFHPLGAPGRKKLKSFLIDGKIPARSRDAIPLVCRGEEILWVAGHRIGEGARVTAATRRFLLLSLVSRKKDG